MKNQLNRIAVILIFLLILPVTAGFSQIISGGNPGIETNSGPGFLNSVMNPNRFQMNQSVSFTAMSGGGMSGSVGVFSNYLNYRVSDKLNLSAGLHLIKPSFSSAYGDLQKPDFNFDLQLNYKFSDNFKLQVNLVKMNPSYYSSYSSGYSRRGFMP